MQLRYKETVDVIQVSDRDPPELLHLEVFWISPTARRTRTHWRDYISRLICKSNDRLLRINSCSTILKWKSLINDRDTTSGWLTVKASSHLIDHHSFDLKFISSHSRIVLWYYQRHQIWMMQRNDMVPTDVVIKWPISHTFTVQGRKWVRVPSVPRLIQPCSDLCPVENHTKNKQKTTSVPSTSSLRLNYCRSLLLFNKVATSKRAHCWETGNEQSIF